MYFVNFCWNSAMHTEAFLEDYGLDHG